MPMARMKSCGSLASLKSRVEAASRMVMPVRRSTTDRNVHPTLHVFRGSLGAVDALALRMLADDLHLFRQIVNAVVGFRSGVFEVLESVHQGEHGGEVALTTHGPAQVPKVGNLGKKRAVHVFNQIARKLLGMGQQLPQRHSANRLFGKHHASFSIEWRASDRVQ